MLIVLVSVALVSLIGFGVLLTQPMLSVDQRPATAAVDPERLRDHVRMLSETCFPRDAGHPFEHAQIVPVVQL